MPMDTRAGDIGVASGVIRYPSLLSYYSSVESASVRSELVVALCQRNILRLTSRDGKPTTSVSCDRRPLHTPRGVPEAWLEAWLQHESESACCTLLAHYVCTTYFDLVSCSLVVEYLLDCIHDDPGRWSLMSPSSGSLLTRAVARTLLAEDALQYLFLTKGVLCYLELLDYAADSDPEGFLRQLLLDVDPSCARGSAPTLDVTALHSILLIPGRVAQLFPELTLELATPLIHLSQQILTSLLRDSCIAMCLLRYAAPSPIRVLIENLALVPRSSKGIRLMVVLSIVQILVATCASSDDSNALATSSLGRLWIEEFAFSEGPQRTLFTVSEWCSVSDDEGRQATPVEPPHADDWIDAVIDAGTSPQTPNTLARTARKIDTLISGRSTAPELLPPPPHDTQLSRRDDACEADSADGDVAPLRTPEDRLVFDLICLLLALPDDGSMFYDDLYAFYKQTVECSSYQEAESLQYETLLSRALELRVITQRGQHEDGNDRSCPLGELGFRMLVHALSISKRPELSFFMGRLLVAVVKLFGDDLVTRGLISDSVAAALHQLLVTDDSQSAHHHRVSSLAFFECGTNNEFVYCVGAAVELFVRCCKSSTLFARQEVGGSALARLVVALVSSKKLLVSAAAVKAIRFFATRRIRKGLSSACNPLLYETLVQADLLPLIASELLSSPSTPRRKYSLLQLMRDICVECPHLQSDVLPYTTNLVLLLRLASSEVAYHSLLPLCSSILSSFSLAQHDRAFIVCQSLLGVVTSLDPTDTSNLIGCCWALQTLTRLVIRERSVQCFFRDLRGELFHALRVLCPVLVQLRREFDDDATEAFRTMTAAHRHVRDRHAVHALPRYLMCCDVLVLVLHAVNAVHCLQSSSVADDSAPCLVQTLRTGPFLKCRLFTSVVVRSLLGMAAFSNEKLLGELHHQDKVSMLPQPPPPASCRVSLNNLTAGWQIHTTVGDALFEGHQQRIVRPQFIFVLLELMKVCPCEAVESGFELFVSVVEVVFHVFHERVENLYLLSSCSVWDVAVRHIVRMATENPALRSRCSTIVTNSVKLFGAYGIGPLSLSAQLLLCFETRDTSDADGSAVREFVESDVCSAVASWESLMLTNMPCRLPQQFFSVPFGCETVTRQRLPASATAAMKAEVGLRGGVDLAVNYDVWRMPVDTHVTAVSWFMSDAPRGSLCSDAAILSMHFDRNRVVFELGVDEYNALFVAVHSRNLGETRSRRVPLGSKLPLLVSKQWYLLHMSIENFAAKSQSRSSLRSKLNLAVQVGVQWFQGNQRETSVVDVELEIFQSIREKSLSRSTVMTHVCFAALHCPVAGARHRTSSVATSTTSFVGAPPQAVLDAPQTSVSQHPAFYGSSGIFHGTLSPFELLVLFVMGSDGLLSMDFTDRVAVVHCYPLLARLSLQQDHTNNNRAHQSKGFASVAQELSMLAAMWLRRQEIGSETQPPVFSGYFPLPTLNRDKTVVIAGAMSGDICLWTRRETAAAPSVDVVVASGSPSSALTNASAFVSPNSLHLRTLSESFAVTSGGGTMTPAGLTHSGNPSMIGGSGGAAERTISSVSGPHSNVSSSVAAALATANTIISTTEFICFPRSKALSLVHLDVSQDDPLTTWDEPVFYQESALQPSAVASLLHKPLLFVQSSYVSHVETLGGLPHLLWLATLVPPDSQAQVRLLQGACTYLMYIRDTPLSDTWNGEASKRQDLTLLTVLLHTRIPITEAIAKSVTRTCGFPMICRIDLLPLLLDFSLWARHPDALNCVAEYLVDLLSATNAFYRFNTELLRQRRALNACTILEELLLHMHMRCIGTTVGEWSSSTIPHVRALLSTLCTGVATLDKITASAAWLATDEVTESSQWTLCLLDAAVTAAEERMALQSPPATLVNNVVTILKSKQPEVRCRGLRLFLRLPMSVQLVTNVVAQYEARSLLYGTKRCITSEELRLLMTAAVGSETWLHPERLSLAAHIPQRDDVAPASGRPMVFMLIVLIPYITEAQQLIVVEFLSDMFSRIPSMQRAALERSFSPPLLDDPLTSYLLFAIAETFERNDRSLDVGDGRTIAAIVELLIDICAGMIHHLHPPHYYTSSVETISSVLFSIFSAFVDDDDIGVRNTTPQFLCARRHLLNVSCACLHAFDSKLDTASNPAYLDCAWQFLELLNDVCSLLCVPSAMVVHREESVLMSPAQGSFCASSSPVNAALSGSAAPSPRVRGSSNPGRPVTNACCSYFTRVGATNRSLRVRKAYSTLTELDLVHISRDNTELVPIYAMQCSCKLYFKVLSGATPASAHMDKHATARLCSQLHQQQLKLVSFLLAIDNSELADGSCSNVDEIKTLTLLHVYSMGAAMFGLNVPSAEKKPKKPQPLMKPPANAKWSEATLDVAPDSLLMTAVIRYKEPALAIFNASMGFLRDLADPDMRTPSHINRATVCMNICRVLTYHTKAIPVRKELTEQCVTSCEWLLNQFVSVTSLLPDERAGGTLRRLEGNVLNPHAVSAVQKQCTAMIQHAQTKAMQSLRVASGFVPSLEPMRALQSRENINSILQQLMAVTMKRADFYKRHIEQDSHVCLAANAAYRFALLPWWGCLSAMYTDQPVALNRWELDRFLGPDWERGRLRRFAHSPTMMTHETNSLRFFDPLLSVDVLHDLDDQQLLEQFSVTAVPQSVQQRVLQTGNPPMRCLMVLPMDRVPVLITLSQVALAIQAELNRPTEAAPRPGNVTARRATTMAPHAAAARSKKTRSATLSKPNTESSAAGASQSTSSERALTFHNPKYTHEVPVHLRVVPLSCVRAVWPRRNLLQHVALELLLDSGESVLLAFESTSERKTVMEKLIIYAKLHLDKTLNLSESSLKTWRTWWCEGRISNFKYLMYLNLCAGRSYGDMRQYPIFPHVVADYTSKTLDLRIPNTYRILEKPMGAQSPEREEKVVAKFNEIASLGFHEYMWGSNLDTSEVDLDMIPLHYGSHYSPPGGALHFLVRVQPFADYFLDMNSKLDDADRVFESMMKAYSISSTGKDVKEMVPEFYVLPEMYLNLNHVPFGTKQDGSVVSDVALPPWASSPRSFVVQLRRALESRHCSERLHHWIDLIFGFKQRGKEAVTAINTFHPLTYEGTVDLQGIDDPVRLKSMITQIDSFGQTPVQLFPKTAHKARCKPSGEFHSIPCPTLRFDTAFAKSSVCLFPERLVALPAANNSGVLFPLGGAAANAGGRSDGTGAWVTFCRSPMTNAALGADELGDWLLSSGARSVYHVLPSCVAPFTVVADNPKDFVVVRLHTMLLVDAKDPTRELASARVSRSTATVLAVHHPHVFVGTSSGGIIVAEIRIEEVVDIEIPQPTLATSGDGSPATSSGDALAVDEREEFGFVFSSRDVKTQRVKAPTIRVVDHMHGHHGAVVAAHVAPEWGVMVTAAQDSVVAVWDIHRRLLIRTIPFPQLAPAAAPLQLFHSALVAGEDSDTIFHPVQVCVNPLRGDIVVAGLRSNASGGEVRVYTINGELSASTTWKGGPTGALCAVGPVIFTAEGRTLVTLDSTTLERVAEVVHHTAEDTIVSVAVNPYGTCVAAVDRHGNAASWKVAGT